MSFVPREQSKLHTLPYACVGVVQNLAPPMGVPGSGHVVAEKQQTPEMKRVYIRERCMSPTRCLVGML